MHKCRGPMFLMATTTLASRLLPVGSDTPSDRVVAHSNGANDLVPFWITMDQLNIRARMPILHHTSELDRFKRMKRQIYTYQVVLWQSRQEVLMSLLST